MPPLCSVALPVLWNCPTRHHRASRPYPFGFSVRTLGNHPKANGGASRVPYNRNHRDVMPLGGTGRRCFRACQGSPTPPGLSTPRPSGANRVAFRVLGAHRHPSSTLISGLNTLPARCILGAPSRAAPWPWLPPVNASPQPSPTTTHDSGPVWLAKPSLSETFTPSHLAGFPGAP